MKYIFLSGLVLILALGLISAADFTISSTQITTDAYRGDFVQFAGIVTADSGNYCDIQCLFNVGSNSGYVSDSGNSPPTTISYGERQEFPFSIRADGNGIISQKLVVSCDRIPNYFNCWPDTKTSSKNITFTFLYAGDGVCTTSKEKCANYQTFIGTSDCVCAPGKECRPDGLRSPDDRGCQTYCGNGIYEPGFEDCSCSTDFTCALRKTCKPAGRALDSDGCGSYCGNGICEGSYENCSSCAQDCKSCNYAVCTKDADCSGKYCVWGVCWNTATRVNDSHCDSTKGENCANSALDCACSTTQRCNSGGFCETYCGNNVCEQTEAGICRADCKWCGDGTCQTGESCASCADDCGMCREDTINDTIENNTSENNTIINETEIIQNNSDNINPVIPDIQNQTNEPVINNTPEETDIDKIDKNTSKTSSQEARGAISDYYKIIIIIILAVIFIIVYFLFAGRIFRKKEAQCRYCKRKIEGDSVFCIYCGKRLR